MGTAAESAKLSTVPGEDGRHVTFCRLCEAVCGMVATVKQGRIVAAEPDRDNPHSQGHVCVKGVGFHHVTHDPDRVLTPLRREPDGSFAPVSWDEALGDIAARLGRILDDHGADALACYTGNPSSFATDMAMSLGPFMKALGKPKGYSPGSQDNNARAVANFALYGSVALNAFPDLPNCDFLMVLGGNPLVSNGSLMFAPRVRHDLDGIAARGRVVVVDPRRSETARRYEHQPITPNSDVWLLLGTLGVLVAEGRIDRVAVAQVADGLDEICDFAAAIDLADAARQCGIAAATIRDLALSYADTPRAAIYGRVGICRSPFATLANCLVTILDVVAGKFGKRGGTIFGHRVLAGQEKASFGGYGDTASRIGGIPSVARFLPSSVMADDILEPGEGQVRAMLLTSGNPLLSAPGGARLEQALQSLELLVSFDFYINETARFAHYILPTPTFYERPDFPYIGLGILMRPFVQVTDAVLPLQGEARHEHDIWRELIERMGRTWPARGDGNNPLPPGIARMDAQLRNGPIGDGYGVHEGWSYERLLDEQPHGVMVELADPTNDWQDRLAHPEGKVQLNHPLIAAELARLRKEWQPQGELSLIGRRDIRSINSWMHNVDGLVRSQKPELLVSAPDIAKYGLSDGGTARLASAHGAIEVTVAASDEVSPGTVCYPHGWGHNGNWQRANRAPGTNINELLGLGLAATEFVSGSTLMDGIAVTVEPLAQTAAA